MIVVLVLWDRRDRRVLRRLGLVVAAALMTLTGHLGGSLVHGPRYLTDVAPAPVRTALDVERATCLSPGDELAVVVEATGDALTMTIERVAPEVDAAGMVIAEGTLPPSTDIERVRPGMLVDVRLLTDNSDSSARFCPP